MSSSQAKRSLQVADPKSYAHNYPVLAILDLQNAVLSIVIVKPSHKAHVSLDNSHVVVAVVNHEQYSPLFYLKA